MNACSSVVLFFVPICIIGCVLLDAVSCLPKKYDLQREPLECLTSKQRQHVFRIQCCKEDFCNRNEMLKLTFMEGIKQKLFQLRKCSDYNENLIHLYISPTVCQTLYS